MPARRTAGCSRRGLTVRAAREGQPPARLLAALRLAGVPPQRWRAAQRGRAHIFAGANPIFGGAKLVLGRFHAGIFKYADSYHTSTTPLFHTHLITKPFVGCDEIK